MYHGTTPVRRTLWWATLLTALAFAATPARADRFDEAREIFAEAEASAPYFEKAYGYALFPGIGKGGFGIGGARGKGRVYVGGRHVGNTTMTQVSVGFQLGGQSFSQIVFFEDEEAFADFTSGNFEFGAQASAVAITASASASSTTAGSTAAAGGSRETSKLAGGYTNGYAIFTAVKGGLMYEASIGGQKFSYNAVE